MSLQRYGEWAVVLGASEGIGAAYARELAKAGLSLVLVARRTEPLEALAKELRAGGRNVETLALDLGAPDVEAKLRAMATSKNVGVVVYNAAYAVMGRFFDTDVADKERIIAVNARGPVIAAQVFGEQMRARKRGALVFMSSLAGFVGAPYIATYGSTRAFTLGLGEALSGELEEFGIDVIACCAGSTETPGFERATTKYKPKSMPADAVARETLQALDRGHRGAFIPGRFNRIAQWFLVRTMPRGAAVKVMGAETKKML